MLRHEKHGRSWHLPGLIGFFAGLCTGYVLGIAGAIAFQLRLSVERGAAP